MRVWLCNQLIIDLTKNFFFLQSFLGVSKEDIKVHNTTFCLSFHYTYPMSQKILLILCVTESFSPKRCNGQVSSVIACWAANL